MGVPVAVAASTSTDPKDGRGSRLDIKSLAVGGSAGSLVLTMKTHKPFANSLLANQPKRRWLCVYLWKNTSDPTQDSDFLPCARVRNGKLYAQVWSRAADAYVQTGAKVARVDRRTMRFTIPTTIFEGATGVYYWGATRDGAQRSFDVVPNAGPMLAPLP